MTDTSLAASSTSADEEFRAKQALGFDDGPDIEGLIAPTTAGDRKRFNALLRAKPSLAQSMTLDMYKAKRINAQIAGTVTDFIAGKPSLIAHLGAGVLSLASAEELRATPSVFLQRILDSTETQDLTSRLLGKLRWYGANSGEQTSASVRHQLICKAICLHYHQSSADESQELAGFRWQDPAHWGKSYQVLHSDFERHLLHTHRAANIKEAILLAHVFQTRLSKDFAVPDIPADLRYKSSVVWVNFMHGVLLADELGLQTLSFQQLVNLPLERSVGATSEELETIARLRMSPALEWAICVGVVQSRTASDYDEKDIERALAALESHNESLGKAVMALDLPHPDRLKMAKRVKDDLFGSDALESDGRKLLPEELPDGGRSRTMPTLALPGHGFLDLYADGQFDDGGRWFITEPDGKTRTRNTFRIDDKRIFYSETKVNGSYRETFSGGILRTRRGRTLPDINAQFETDFQNYLSTIRTAYQTLIASLLVSLPLADRRALEQSEVVVLSLRQNIPKDRQRQEVRARKGFLLQVTREKEDGDKDITYYELIPNVGFIRQRTRLRFSTIDGVFTEFPLHASIPGQTFAPGLSTSLLIDWPAHLYGRTPANRASSTAFVDPVGLMPADVSSGSATNNSEVTPLASSRLNAVAHYIASNFLYVDEQELRVQARGITVFDSIRARTERRLETFLAIAKGFVPFWGSVEDLLSDNVQSKLSGGVGLLMDLASFLFPVGKFMSGTVRLMRLGTGVSSMAVKTSLPSFSRLTRNLLITTATNLNPLDGVPTLLKTMGSGAAKGLLAAGRLSLVGIKKLAGQVDSYRLVHHLPQSVDPGSWKSLTNSDGLATVNGVDNVLVRNTSPSDLNRFHLVDPLTSLPYGPRLRNDHLVPGRSTFKTLSLNESHVLAKLPENAHVREILEVDGRTTMLIDDTPYRLDGNQLRRADLIDDRSMLKSLPCRLRRTRGSEKCRTRYVTRDPAPTPAIGSYDESKGWAPWFGDSIYTPATADRMMLLKTLKKKSRLPATMEFQKGIFGRIKVEIPYGTQNRFDTFQAGATIVPAMDGSRRYVFTRLDAGAFYVAELTAAQNLSSSLTLRKANTLAGDLKKELMTVYTGSLNANNMVRIYGTETVERALKTMEEIAIPITGLKKPPDTLKKLKVDTKPGEAVLFDHTSRMIVIEKSKGARSWSRSKVASEAFRQRTVEIFDTLFLERTIVLKNPDSALKINTTMKKLHNLIPRDQRPFNARNIAYAEVTTVTGTREVYVSVSGAQGATGYLPLFRQHLGADQVKVGETTYFNVDMNNDFPNTSLHVSDEGKLLAVPMTIVDVENYRPTLTRKPTSLDSESKLISVIREKYRDYASIESVNIATTMPPCESCSVVVKEFGYDGGENALNVLWM
ncbi:hypothetical protein [Pseudomonas sp. C2B4]|uniref:hypothetical protein n=1 Tax=Pseudomonas sp. C2B4 TaxID=2735270 RepID=UPI001586DD83|nr:hypothetical protein [Pseudomonas sp. C2B4]NUU35690.1 hypothetical protein [Pseudomonas sp. C2B4]